MAHWLRTLDALVENQSSVPGTHVGGSYALLTSVWGI